MCGNSASSAAIAIVAGFGFGALLGAPTRYIVTNETTERTRATAIGLLSQFLIIGQILGGSIAGGIMGSALSDTAAYRNTYLAFAAIAMEWEAAYLDRRRPSPWSLGGIVVLFIAIWWGLL